MMMIPAGLSVAKAPECQICYEAFDGRARRPQRLPCRHRVCARCLRGMAAAAAAAAEAPGGSLRCPFCRRQAPMPGQDDDGAEALLLGRRLPGPAEEVLLCPGAIPESLATASPSPSDCLVVTLLEVPGEEAASGSAPGGLLELLRLYRRASLASVRCSSPLGKRWPRPSGGGGAGARRSLPRLLLALLALLSFSSLPLGLYLLLVGRLGPGAVLASLVPSGLLLALAASLCRCLWHDARRPPSTAAAAAGGGGGGRTPPPRPQLPPSPARPPSGSAAAGFAEPLPGAGGRPGESRDPLEPPPDSAPGVSLCEAQS